jgi:hypothetical protein
MIGEVRGSACLDGFRGQPPVDRAALMDTIVRLTRLAGHPLLAPLIAEIEINPLLVGSSGVVALDVAVTLSGGR